jgi:hypothetical protein
MLGLAFLQRGGLWKFVLAISVAGLFHKSAIVLILIALTSRSKRKLLTGIAVLGIAAGLYVLLMAEAVDALRVGYLDTEYQSAGAGVRVAMNALPALIRKLFLAFNFCCIVESRPGFAYIGNSHG